MRTEKTVVSRPVVPDSFLATRVPPKLPARPPRMNTPASGQSINGIEIDFIAGFGDAGPDVPDGLRRAILLLVAHWYEFRAAVGPQDQPVGYPPGYDRLIAGWRQRRLS